METTLYNMMLECRNFFLVNVVQGTHETSENSIALTHEPLVGQYIRLKGSVLNDGVYKITTITKDAETGRYLCEIIGAQKEKFKGEVWLLAVPQTFVELSQRVKSFQELQSKDKSAGTVQSESFTGYSYSMATGKNGVITWKEKFSNELNSYKRFYPER